MSGFEGSYLGDQKKIDAQSALECGVCWWVYDPAKGDAVWQIPVGTPFSELPDHWRCPSCDAAQHQFMFLGSSGADDDLVKGSAKDTAGRNELTLMSQKLGDAYRRIDRTMKTLPVYNPALETAVVGLQAAERGYAAVVATPWCMNIVLVRHEDDGLAEGTIREQAFPSGSYPMVRGYLKEVGVIESCSLFSPMDQFESQEAVLAVAEEAVRAVFTSTQDASDQTALATEDQPEDPSRRRFLKGATASASDDSAAKASRDLS